jgi:cyclophilin family peptidyl-prolyl cis-trans isomerase
MPDQQKQADGHTPSVTTARWPWIAGAMLILTIVGLATWFASPENVRSSTSPAPQVTPSASGPHGSSNPTSVDDLAGSLLDRMGDASTGRGTISDTSPALTNEELEEQYTSVGVLQQQIDVLKGEAATAAKSGNQDDAVQKLTAAKGAISELEEKVLSLQGALRVARAARPDDPTVQWLTGELLIRVGGEPEEILPYFERAVNGGLLRPDVVGGLARVQFEANQFEAAYRSGLRALSLNDQDRKVWELFEPVALGFEQFDTVVQRIDSAFPRVKPVWAADIRGRAQTLSQERAKEEKLRTAENAAGDLPQVRLTIEHVTFEPRPDGSISDTPKATGRDEVVVELFENQAPITVANFLSLVQSGFYNGTRFHWAQSAGMVVGGDPNSKNNDPKDDGAGGPGYVIPDEFNLPVARSHFRGTLAMVATGPHTAGSQFLIALVPHPTFDRHFTAFGRVIRGQEGVDRITAGRTNFRVGQFGKAIPGDLLVRAEVIRKRPHPYRVVKEKP